MINKTPVKLTSHTVYLEENFSDITRDLTFYGIGNIKEAGYDSYVENLKVKCCYKYKTIRAKIR